MRVRATAGRPVAGTGATLRPLCTRRQCSTPWTIPHQKGCNTRCDHNPALCDQNTLATPSLSAPHKGRGTKSPVSGMANRGTRSTLCAPPPSPPLTRGRYGQQQAVLVRGQALPHRHAALLVRSHQPAAQVLSPLALGRRHGREAGERGLAPVSAVVRGGQGLTAPLSVGQYGYSGVVSRLGSRGPGPLSPYIALHNI